MSDPKFVVGQVYFDSQRRSLKLIGLLRHTREALVQQTFVVADERYADMVFEGPLELIDTARLFTELPQPAPIDERADCSALPNRDDVMKTSDTDLLTRRRPDPLHLSMETRAETMARRQTENPPDREVENNTPPAWLREVLIARRDGNRSLHRGIIIRLNDRDYVFVRQNGKSHAMAMLRENLSWARDGASDKPHEARLIDDILGAE